MTPGLAPMKEGPDVTARVALSCAWPGSWYKGPTNGRPSTPYGTQINAVARPAVPLSMLSLRFATAQGPGWLGRQMSRNPW